MAKKIPITTLDASNVSTSITQAPPQQYAEFTEYRETMAAYCKARVWFADAVASPDAEPPIKFWFANGARRSIFASLMHDWYAGYWPARHDLFVSSRGVGESTFGRILKEAVDGGFMIIDTDDDDGRTKIIKPFYHRQEREFFMIAINVHQEADFFDVTIENEDDGFLAFEFPTKNDAMAFADRVADLFNSVGPVQITTPLSVSPAARSDSMGEELSLGR